MDKCNRININDYWFSNIHILMVYKFKIIQSQIKNLNRISKSKFRNQTNTKKNKSIQ